MYEWSTLGVGVVWAHVAAGAPCAKPARASAFQLKAWRHSSSRAAGTHEMRAAGSHAAQKSTWAYDPVRIAPRVPPTQQSPPHNAPLGCKAASRRCSWALKAWTPPGARAHLVNVLWLLALRVPGGVGVCNPVPAAVRRVDLRGAASWSSAWRALHKRAIGAGARQGGPARP